MSSHSTTKSVLICDHLSAQATSRLASSAQVKLQKAQHLKPSATELEKAQVLLIRSRTPVEAELLAQAPQLELVITATSGFDHIDLKACQARGVKVGYTPEANVHSVAELTFSLMIQLLRHLPQSARAMAQGRWRDSLPRGSLLRGQELGIIGLGRIGSQVARLGQAFGLKLWAYDPYVDNEHFIKLGVERLGLTELLRQADIVTLHVPYTKETHHLINRPTLETINPEAYLLNTSRGKMVDENELVEALDKGRLKGVALDVFAKEPLPKDSRLRGFDRVILTPHLGAYSQEAFEQASLEAAQNLLSYLETGELASALPGSAPWAQGLL